MAATFQSYLENQLATLPHINVFIEKADHIDVKTVEGDVSLREFIAGCFNYMPRWLQALYTIRWGFVRLLGMKQTGIPGQHSISPEEVSFVAGEMAAFFQVKAAKEKRYWFAAATDKHLTAHLGVVVEPLTEQTRRFYVLTLVDYQHWTGVVYFNVIRPFHHLVVHQMMQAAVK